MFWLWSNSAFSYCVFFDGICVNMKTVWTLPYSPVRRRRILLFFLFGLSCVVFLLVCLFVFGKYCLECAERLCWYTEFLQTLGYSFAHSESDSNSNSNSRIALCCRTLEPIGKVFWGWGVAFLLLSASSWKRQQSRHSLWAQVCPYFMTQCLLRQCNYTLLF